MIPITLKIKGLYSFLHEVEIDFTKLGKNNIFGIFGTVGSGKSTILEAIVYALYNKSNRLNDRGDDKFQNMMNLKSNELLIDFVFKKDSNTDICYQAIVSGKRKKNGSVDTFKTQYYQIINNSKLNPISEEEFLNVIGICYDDFIKTIIIPQGQFKEFLELTTSNRTALLERLFNLSKFDLEPKRKRIEDKTVLSKTVIEDRLKSLIDVNEENFNKQTNELNDALSNSVRINELLNDKIEEEKQLENLNNIFNELESIRITHSNHIKLKDDYKERQIYLDNYIKVQDRIKPVLNTIYDFNKEIENNNHELKEANNSILILDDKLKTYKQKINTLKPDFDNIPFFEKQNDDYNRLIKIVELEDIIKENEIKFNTITIDKLINEDLINTNRSKYNILINEIDELNNSLEQLKDIHEANNWFTKINIIKCNLDKYLLEKEKCTKLLVKEKEAFNKLLCNELFEIDNTLLTEIDNPDLDILLNNKKLNIDNNIILLKNQIEKLQEKQALANFASTLIPDEPCPLCGSLHHVSPLIPENVESELNNINTELIHNVSIINKIDSIKIIIIKCNAKIENLKNDQKKIEESIYFEENQISDLIKLFIWKNYNYNDNGDDVLQDIEKEKIIKKELKIKQKQKIELDSNYNILLQEKETLVNEFNSIQLSDIALKAQKETYKNELVALNVSDYIEYDKTKLIKTKNELINKIVNIKSKYLDIENIIKELNEKITQCNNTIFTMEKIIKNNINNLDVKKEELNRILKDLNISIENAYSLSKDTINIETEQETINKYFREIDINERKIQELENKVNDKIYDKEYHVVLISEINKYKEEQKITTELIGKIKNIIDKMQKQLTEKKELIKQDNILADRIENLKILSKMFKAKGFVNYISTIYLMNLVNDANIRFQKLTKNQLHLELIEKEKDNELVIRDFLNEGKIRSIKTLSGGQMFQASLSLALALSENVALYNKSKHNFFFLDEGFGSLDKDSLMIVFDTLQELKNENRIIGIISHVEDLQQEIDLYIKIEKSLVDGSQIIKHGFN